MCQNCSFYYDYVYFAVAFRELYMLLGLRYYFVMSKMFFNLAKLSRPRNCPFH